jgi:hypothetical protein
VLFLGHPPAVDYAAVHDAEDRRQQVPTCLTYGAILVARRTGKRSETLSSVIRSPSPSTYSRIPCVASSRSTKLSTEKRCWTRG